MNPIATWWLVLAGWSVVVALWHTSAIALAFATWRLWRRRASARAEYAAASAALALAVALTVATPFALRLPLPVRPVRPAPTAATASSVDARPLAVPLAGAALPGTDVRTAVASFAARAVPWLGALWSVGAAVALARLAGGWALALWIRRRATRVDAPYLVDAVADVSARWGLPPATLLASAHVDAPVVVGARAPAILLPVDLGRHLAPEAVPPLLAHELAHIRRGDYASNLVQSIADAVLWFSPGARFLSRSVREAREYCCDDVVAERWGASAYAAALTTLAGLGVAARARPAINAAGPRLIIRIRRLLEEDAMGPFAGSRLVGVALAFALVAAAGRAIVPLSAAGLAQATPVKFTTPIDGPVPSGFVVAQPNAAVALRDMTSNEAAYCGTATVENRANVAVTGLRFAAYAHARGPEGSTLGVGSVQTSGLLPVDVAPHQHASVAVGLMSLENLRQTLRTGHPQVMCALTEIRYANGSTWTAALPTVFGPEHAEVSRDLVGRPGTPGQPICRDDRGGEYSEGAVVPIALEPGTFARCHDGAWNEYRLPPMQPDVPR